MYQYEVNQAALALSADDGGETPHNEPKGALLFIPHFFYSHSKAVGRQSSALLQVGAGTSKGGGFTLMGKKKVNDWLTAGLVYQFDYADYSGGTPVPANTPAAKFDGHKDETVNAHAVSLSLEGDFKEYGRLNFIAAQIFTYYDGTETFRVNPNNAGWHSDTRGIDARDRVTGLHLFYEKDLPINDSWTITPWLHWGTSYTLFKKMNNFANNGNPAKRFMGVHDWTHFASGGAKFNYQQGLTGVHGYIGYDQIVSGFGQRGFVVRVMGVGIAQPGHQADADKKVMPVGLGVTRVVPDFGVLNLEYNGMFGKNTDAHAADLVMVFPF